jgi:hypothetical protein
LSDRQEWSPERLKANEGLAYQGSIVLGMGFVLTPDDARHMLDADPKNAEVIFPYINGDDLNSDPEQMPSRWVINFWDWPEAKAKTYKLPYKWLEDNVKAGRLANKDKGAREKWWLFLRARSELYHAIGRGHHFERHPDGWSLRGSQPSRVLAITRVSKTLAFSFVDSNIVFSDATVAFSLGRGRDFALLQSSIHAAFAWQHASRLKSDLRYSQTDALEPFAFPGGFSDAQSDSLDGLGDRFHQARIDVMRADRIGLTQLYNRFHANTERDPRIEGLREFQREIDAAVACAYGWDDLDLEHGFHEVPYLPDNDRARFTISESARVEVLRRLSHLNRQRYEEEVARGLHGKAAGSGLSKPRTARVQSAPAQQPSFDFDATPANECAYLKVAEPGSHYGADPAQAIAEHLRAHPGWHAKSDIVAGTGIKDGQWNAAIADLIANGKVERQGEKRGARYRVVTKGAKE